MARRNLEVSRLYPVRCLAVVMLTQCLALVVAADKPATPDSTVWEESIQKFEAHDRESPPAKGGILFIGGSNIRRWKLVDEFSDLPVINRGFGGSMIADAVYYADRIVIPYQPATIVLYGGANDMGRRGRKTPRQVLADYEKFVATVHEHLPKTRIIYMSLPHFYSQRNDPEAVGKVALVNQLVSDAVKKEPRLTFADVNQPMADENGQPRGELFLKDGVHMNAAGYKVWAAQLRPLLLSADGE